LATASSELLLSILTVSFPRSATILYAMPHPLHTSNYWTPMFGDRFVRNWPIICPIGGMVNGTKAALKAVLVPFRGLSHRKRRFALQAGQDQTFQQRVLPLWVSSNLVIEPTLYCCGKSDQRQHENPKNA
jgi:hypothetical protein